MIEKRNIVITGGSRGIGRSVAIHFAKNGWNIAFCSRNPENISNLLAELMELNPEGKHLGASCNVANKDDLFKFCQKVSDTYSQIHCLVNNAGIFIPGKTTEEPDGLLEEMISTNLYSAYHTTRQLLKKLLPSNGHIFNICSVASIQAYPNGGSYSVSKFALLGYSKTLREELKSDGVKVTAVLPGATKTDSWSGSDLPDERFMQPQDIAQSIWDIYHLGPATVVEEILLRPLPGDI